MRTRLHTLDELHEYYVSLDVAISKIRSGLLLSRSSVAEERRWLLSAMWRYRTRVQWARSTGIQENSQSE